MKSWAFLTTLLYLAVLSVLCVPLLLLLWDPSNSGMLQLFYIWIVPVLVLCQAALLFVPVAVSEGRPVARRRVAVSAVIGAIPMAVMVAAIVQMTALMIWPEGSPFWSGSPKVWVGSFLGALGALWAFWGTLFYRSYASADPLSFSNRTTRWLMKGSILEVIVAIPSHIISRNRGECCAPMFSLLGIATGLSIALMAFGPSVFLLFAKRIRAKRGTTVV